MLKNLKTWWRPGPQSFFSGKCDTVDWFYFREPVSETGQHHLKNTPVMLLFFSFFLLWLPRVRACHRLNSSLSWKLMQHSGTICVSRWPSLGDVVLQQWGLFIWKALNSPYSLFNFSTLRREGAKETDNNADLGKNREFIVIANETPLGKSKHLVARIYRWLWIKLYSDKKNSCTLPHYGVSKNLYFLSESYELPLDSSAFSAGS